MLRRWVVLALLLVGVRVAVSNEVADATQPGAPLRASLSIDERILHQGAVEQVYYQHRTKANY